MSKTLPPAASKRKKWLLLLLSVIAVGGIVLWAMNANRNREAGSPILGTWKSEFGGVVNFRADGTGRGRMKADPRIRAFDWSIDESNHLVFYERTTRGGLIALVEQIDRLRGGAQPSRNPIKFDGDTYTLSNRFLNRETGKDETTTIVFTRCEDPVLEASP